MSLKAGIGRIPRLNSKRGSIPLSITNLRLILNAFIMRTEKQKQASNRNYSLMVLIGIKTRLKDLKSRSNAEHFQNCIDTLITYVDYATILSEESTTNDWNSNKQ